MTATLPSLVAAAPTPFVPNDTTDLTTRFPALHALRRSVLESLRGPGHRNVYQIPRPRPVSRAQVEGVLAMLLEEGLIERVADPRFGGAVPAYRATEAGRRALAVGA